MSMRADFYLEQKSKFNRIIILMTLIGVFFLISLFYSLIHSTQIYWAFQLGI